MEASDLTSHVTLTAMIEWPGETLLWEPESNGLSRVTQRSVESGVIKDVNINHVSLNYSLIQHQMCSMWFGLKNSLYWQSFAHKSTFLNC